MSNVAAWDALCNEKDAEIARVRDYANRMDALAEERLIEAGRLRLGITLLRDRLGDGWVVRRLNEILDPQQGSPS